jgi:ABC-type amino acid transport system permease subunit
VVVGWLNDNNINPDTFWVGACALGINYGAYLSEVYRAGILTIDHGQWEAAHSLGMRGARVFRRVILPQAFRVVIPPMANNFITLIQDSSYLSAIALVELTNASEALAAGNNVDTRWQIYAMAGLLYFALCYPVALLARHAEQRLRRRIS